MILETNKLDSNMKNRITNILEKSVHQGIGKEYFLICLGNEEVIKRIVFNENSLALILYNYSDDFIWVYDYITEHDEDYQLLEELFDYLQNIVQTKTNYHYIGIRNIIQPESQLTKILQKKEFNLVLRHYMTADKENYQKELPPLPEDYSVEQVERNDLENLALLYSKAMENHPDLLFSPKAVEFEKVLQEFAYSFDNYEYWPKLSYKLLYKGAICGFILLDDYIEKGMGLVSEVCVSSKHQCKKLGQYLVILGTKKLFDAGFDKTILTVTAANSKGVNCFLKSGYQTDVSVYYATYFARQQLYQ